MKIATKTLATLLIVTVLTVSIHGSAGAMSPEVTKKDDKLERLQQHHDRKLELRASVLGMSADELKEELKEKSFDQVIKKRGFKDRDVFYTAFTGKVKEELIRRGWSEQKIDEAIQKRAERLNE